MIILRPMTQAEFDEYYPAAMESLAQAMTEAGEEGATQAREKAQESFQSALPGLRVDTPDHHLRKILHDGEEVGVVWFRIRGERDTPDVFLYDLLVRPRFRRKGLARATLLVLEDEVRRLGWSRISLYLFEGNTAASRLYEGLGYRPYGSGLSKLLESA